MCVIIRMNSKDDLDSKIYNICIWYERENHECLSEIVNCWL